MAQKKPEPSKPRTRKAAESGAKAAKPATRSSKPQPGASGSPAAKPKPAAGPTKPAAGPTKPAAASPRPPEGAARPAASAAGPPAAAAKGRGKTSGSGAESAAELRKLQSAYGYGLEVDTKPLKVAFLISIFFHILLFWFMFPAIQKSEAKMVERKRYVIQKFRMPPPPKKDILQKKKIKQKKEKKVFIPDPTPDEPEPIREAEVAVVDDIPIEDDFIIAAPEQPPGPLIVGGDVKAPVEIYRVEPQYTEIAKAIRKEGIVIVQAVIDRTGVVQNVKVLKGLGFGLDESASDAVKKWKFSPGTLNGKPVDVIFTLTVRFQITT